MDNEIVNENLLSEVLGKKVKYYPDIKCFYEWNQEALNWKTKEMGRWQPIDIDLHNLANKCKLWTIPKRLEIVEYMNYIEVIDAHTKELYQTYNSKNNYDINLIFKACKWIQKEVK